MSKIKSKWHVIAFGIIVVALVINLVLNVFIMQITIPTESMSNTIEKGSRMLISRDNKNINYGDLVVFYSDELDELLIKRLIGMPGDVVDIREGSVYINGEYLYEPYISSYDDYNGTFYVPMDSFLFLGDNRANSLDARYWKNPYIHESSVIGKAFAFIFPFKVVKNPLKEGVLYAD